MAVLPLMSFYGVSAHNKGNEINLGGEAEVEEHIMEESGPLCSQQEEEAQ